MKFLKVALLGSALSFGALAAHATTFDFSYTFDPNNTGNGLPVTISGSFDGTEVGALISNISNPVVSINGNQFSGPLFIEATDASGNWSTSVAPVVSTNDVTQSNFVFADADVSTNPSAVSNYFYITEGQAGGITFNVTDSGGNPLQGFEAANNTHFTVAAAAVPEPSTYTLLAAGLGLIGLVSLRRRQS